MATKLKLYLYVYVPGFEYDSKGPLHIDAIKLDVYLGLKITNEAGNIVNQIQTYKDVLINSTGDEEFDFTKPDQYEDLKLTPCDVIYKTDVAVRLNLKEDHVPYFPVGVVNDPDNKYIAPSGRFFDFVEENEETGLTKHIITFRNLKDQANTSSNLNLNDHTGLFVIPLEQLNSNLLFHFTFFSYIGDLSKKETGTVEIGKVEAEDEAMYTRTEEQLAENGYLKIGEWDSYYNPAVSGSEAKIGKFTTEGQFVAQYWDPELKQKFEKFDIPVNTGFLVAENTNLKDGKFADSYNLIGYDSETLQFKAIQLPCNNYSLTKFYQDFRNPIKKAYPITVQSVEGKKEGVLSEAYMKGQVRYNGGMYANVFQVNFELTIENNTDYLLTPIDLSNIEYLYTSTPSITIQNILNSGEDSAVVQIASEGSFKHFRTIGGFEALQGLNSDAFVYDNNNWETGEWDDSSSKQYDVWFMKHKRGTTNFVNDAKFNISVEFGETDLNTGKSRKLDYIKTTEKLMLYKLYDTIEAGSQDVNPGPGYIPEKDMPGFLSDDMSVCKYLKKSMTGKFHKYKKSDTLYDRGLYYATMRSGEVSSDSILTSGKSVVCELTGSAPALYLNVKIDEISVPYVLTRNGDFQGGGGPKCYSESQENRFGEYKDSYLSWIHKTNLNGITPYGQVDLTLRLGLSPMYFIDKSKSNITLQNESDRQVACCIYNRTAGYLGAGSVLSLVNVNSSDTMVSGKKLYANLLIPDTAADETFEIKKVLGEPSFAPFYIKPSQRTWANLEISSICGDDRFVSINSLIEEDFYIGEGVSLQKGYYAFKITDSDIGSKTPQEYVLNVTYKVGDSISKSIAVTTHHKKLLFAVTKNLTIDHISFDRQQSISNKLIYVSSIGLYSMVNMENTEDLDTNTQVLKSFLDKLIEEENSEPLLIYGQGDNLALIDQIVFPACYTLHEEVEVFPYNNAVSNISKPEYGIEINKSDRSPLYKKYNFTYLPETGEYEVVGYYKIGAKTFSVDTVETRNWITDSSVINNIKIRV